MLSYEIARAINSDRERDIRRAIQERLFRAAMAAQPVVRPPVRHGSAERSRASRLAASRLR